jgi:hypothetical protein
MYRYKSFITYTHMNINFFFQLINEIKGVLTFYQTAGC